MNAFMPHGHCYLWSPTLIALHTGSDILIAASYYSIPLTLFSFIRHRSEFRFSWIFACFGTFILACGTTHLMQIWNIWHSDYFVEGYIKLLTAVVSAITALLLVRYMPAILSMRTPEQLEALNRNLENQARELVEGAQKLERANAQLQDEIQQRGILNSQLKANTDELENFNRTMVGRELRMTELKQEVNALLEQQGQPTRYAALELGS